jgi:hypothetical protein
MGTALIIGEPSNKYEITWIIHEMKIKKIPSPWTGEGRGEDDR